MARLLEANSDAAKVPLYRGTSLIRNTQSLGVPRPCYFDSLTGYLFQVRLTGCLFQAVTEYLWAIPHVNRPFDPRVLGLQNPPTLYT